MQYAKKMLLVDPDTIKRLQPAQDMLTPAPVPPPPPSPHDVISLTPEVSAELDMSRILAKTNISEREKWQLFSVALTRYLHYLSESYPRIEPTPEVEIVQTGLKSDLLSTLPVTARDRGVALYNRLLDSKVITWEDTGLVSVRGKTITNSSIVDLISDVVRNREFSNPAGWQQFMETLSTLNVPREMIVNNKRKKFLNDIRSHNKRQSLKSREDAPTPRKRRALNWSPMRFS